MSLGALAGAAGLQIYKQTTESERFESLRQQATVHYMDWAPSTFSETQWQALLEHQSNTQLSKVLRDVLPTLLNWLEELRR
ncbi:hypothetical protein ACSF64_19855 [Escherichia coli]|uniref:hypothetical protein n=1 Tax=Escherichia coli TaxID=562 RepID=UPI003EE8A233